MSTLQDFIPAPRLREHDEVATCAAASRAMQLARSFDLMRSPWVHALFWLRTLPERVSEGEAAAPLDLRLDTIGRMGDGFRVLEDSSERLVVGAIGRFWKPRIEFADVPADQFAAFAEPGWGKVAWQLHCIPESTGSRVCLELAVTATDEESWRRQERYFRLIGPFSRFIRRHELQLIARELGGATDPDAQRALPGDEIIPAPKAAATDAIVIHASASAVWPWLVQMGGGRAGWYSHDLLDNAGTPSATAIQEELQKLAVGDVLPATPSSSDGFTVSYLEPERALVLTGLFDGARERSLPVAAPKPAHYWHVTWAFVLDPISDGGTRLIVRARVDYAPERLSTRLHVRALSLIHHFMESEQLKNIKARAEGRAATRGVATFPEVVQGAVGAAGMLFNLVTPFLRNVRGHWGLTPALAARTYPGDPLVPEPRWQWTHAVEIDAAAADVWPWVAQLGQDKGGFYSYTALENLAGCEIHNADRVHPEWQSVSSGDAMRLHPKLPPLLVHEVVPEQRLLVGAGIDPDTGRAQATQGTYVAVSWLFMLEPLGPTRTRLISRYRCACSNDLATSLAYGPYIAEAVGFMMDRRMLLGIKERVEQR